MNFFSPEVEPMLLGHEDVFGQFFPSSSCQSTPSIIHSPPLQDQMLLPAFTDSLAGPIYGSPQNDTLMVSSMLAADSYFPPESMLLPPGQQHFPTYPPYTGFGPASSLAADAAFMPCMPDYTINRPSRSHSAASSYGLEVPSDDYIRPRLGRSLSPSSPDLRAYGIPIQDGTWKCAYPGCTSKAVFTRGCDLRKHYKRHTKSYFCHHKGCPQATGGGFSSKKDLSRHEARHNPDVLCDWEGCDRVFSRVDNMRDHVKRIHLKASRHASR